MEWHCKSALSGQTQGSRLGYTIALFISLTVPMTLSLASFPPIANAQELNFLAPEVPQSARTGLKFSNSQILNQGIITRTEVHTTISTESKTVYRDPVYPDDCSEIKPPAPFTIDISSFQPDQDTYSVEEMGEATFISSSTPPASGLRVIVHNITAGMQGNPSPYTDREYDQGIRSEGFQVRFGTSHDGAYLAVVQGKNNFSYEIKRGETLVESGSFVADIKEATEQEKRRETRIEEHSVPEYSRSFARQCASKHR